MDNTKQADWTTMHDNELWQVFQDNGLPIIGSGTTQEEINLNPFIITGNAHVWFWKKSIDGTIEIMLQKRSLTKRTQPGKYHTSAAGHINVGETSIQAALRETSEELGLQLVDTKLHFVHATRIIERSPNDIKHVYLYKLTGDETVTHSDGEVDSVEWRTLDNFKRITRDPENHNLINQGLLYFDTLITALEYTAALDDEMIGL